MEAKHTVSHPLDDGGVQKPGQGENASDQRTLTDSEADVAVSGDPAVEEGKTVTACRRARKSNALEPQEVAIEAGTGIDTETEKAVKRHFEAFKSSYRRTVREAWCLGQALTKAKSDVRHGQWLPWLESIELPHRTAQRFMRLHALHPKCDNLADFGTVDEALRALPPGKPSEKNGGSTPLARADRATSSTKSATAEGSAGDAKEKKAGQATETATGPGRAGTRGSHGGDLTTAVGRMLEVLQGARAWTNAARLSDLREVYRVLQGFGPEIARRREGLSEEKAAEVSKGLVEELRRLLQTVEGR